MTLSRVVAARLAAAAFSSLLALPAPAAAQAAPKLSKTQRTTLEALVTAVDKAAASAAVVPATWQAHVLRASSGAHYVAVHADVPGLTPPPAGVLLYMRLMTHRPAGLQTLAERSAVMEWLKGLRGDPLPMAVRRGMSIPQGELPVGGAAAMTARRGDSSADASNLLRLQERERERAARDRAEREKQRRAELESAAATPAPAMHPFEDFDLQARLTPAAGGLVVERGLTTGPGDYDLYVAWAEPAGSGAPVTRVLTHRLTLPGASATEFAVSDVVVADAVRTLPAPYPVEQQGAHPYAVGALEAQPAGDQRFRVDEALSLVFQVINPAGVDGGAGPPDVEIGFRVTRADGARETLVGTLPAQRYQRATLPADFDVTKGHPLFAAVQAPLRSFARGRYKVTITAVDHVAARQTSRDVMFEVAGTPESLLGEAPAPGQAFRRDAVLSAATLAALTRALTPPAPSPALARALELAAAGRFADLIQAEVTAPAEHPAGVALRGLALYGLGDSPRTVGAQLQQAAAQGAPAPPVHLLLGAVAALGGDDRSAVASWNLARDGGIDDAAVATLLVDAYIRQGDVARAAAMAHAALDSQPGNAAAARGLAATYIATGRYADALALLDARPPGADTDLDTDFLVLHALYAGHVSGLAPGNTAAGHERFDTSARAYVERGGRHAELVRAWLDVVGRVAAR